MDQGKEKEGIERTVKSDIDEKYDRLSQAFLRDKALYEELRFEIERKKIGDHPAPRAPTLMLLHAMNNRNMMFLEWAKLALDENDRRTALAVETITNIIEDFKKRLNSYMTRDTRAIRRKVKSLGSP